MPHDMNGKVLQVGDLVSVPCRVKAIQLTEEFCNVTLVTVNPMYPSRDPSTLVVNARQVKVESRLSDRIVDLPAPGAPSPPQGNRADVEDAEEA